MVKALPPPKPEIQEAPPGMVLSIMPAKHLLWLDDYEFFDQLGRDPLQRAKLWLIKDPKERVAKLKEVLEEYPKEKHRRDILAQAATRGDAPLIRCLLETGLQVNAEKVELTEEEKKADEEAEENGEIPNRPDPWIVPLHIAAKGGHLECVKIMVEEGKADIDFQNQVGYTPLSGSTMHPDIVRYLLDQGADPTITTFTDDDLTKKRIPGFAGADALAMASAWGNVETIKMLLEHPTHGSVEKRAMKSRVGEEPGIWVTPLCITAAASCRHGFDALKFLLERGDFPMEARDGKLKSELLSEDQKQTISDAVSHAALDGPLESLKLLLGYQWPMDLDGKLLPFDLPEKYQKSFVYGAYCALKFQNSPEKFEFINSFGVKEHETMSLSKLPEGQNINIQHLLEDAAEGNCIEGVRMMIDKYGANPDCHRMPPGIKPLFVAAARDKTEAVRLLLEDYKADIHLGSGRYANGTTALQIAICLKAYGSIELLLKHGGPMHHVDEEIRNISSPMTVVLRAESDFETYEISTRLETKETVKNYLKKWKDDWQNQNPPFVLLEIGPEDKEWIEKLQYRRPDEELREKGDGARELNHKEAISNSEMEEDDLRRYTTPFPSYDDRAKMLDNDDDLLPRWEPHLKLA